MMESCQKCMNGLPEGEEFCSDCGRAVNVDSSHDEESEKTNQSPPTTPQFTPHATPAPSQFTPHVTTTTPQFNSADSMHSTIAATKTKYVPTDNDATYKAKYAPVSTVGFVGLMVLFLIPVIGWVSCIAMAAASKNINRRNFAKATILFIFIGIIGALVLYIVADWVFRLLVEHVNNLSDGALGETRRLRDLWTLIKQAHQASLR